MKTNRSNKWVVWCHLNESSSTGTQSIPMWEAKRVLNEMERSIIQPNGCVPKWPRYEIRHLGNPPRKIQ